MDNDGYKNICKANDEIRKKLAGETLKLCDDISNDLGEFFDESLNEMIRFIHYNLFGIDEIPIELVNKLEYEIKLNEPGSFYVSSFNRKIFKALMMRFARPLLDLFIRTPRNQSQRKNKIHAKLVTFNYIGAEKRVHDTIHFLSTGETKYDQTQSDASTEIMAQITEWLKELKESESKGDMYLEIFYDVKEFIKVMKTLIFDFSGILEMYHQEFENFRSVFLNSINNWKEKVRFFN